MRLLRPRKLTFQSGTEDGLSLMEVIAAVTVFAIAAAGVLGMILTGIGTSRDTRNRTAAAGIATEQLELVRADAVAAFAAVAAAPTPSTTIVTLKGLAFTVLQTTAFVPKNVSGGGCNSSDQGGNASVQPELLVTESITWPSMGQTRPVTTSTLLTPPIGTYPSATGGVSISVKDRDNGGVAGIALTVTGASVVTVTTDAGGCAFVPFLAAGTYTVSASTAGYVDGQEQAPSVQSVLVVSGRTANAPFLYDQGAEIDVTLVPATNPAAAANLPVSIGNGGLAGTGVLTFARGIVALTPLFPYLSGYRVWAGRCPEANPDALDRNSQPLYAGHPATTVASVTGGQTTAVDVPVFPLTVDVEKMDKFRSDAIFTATEIPGDAKTPCAAPFNSYDLSRPDSDGVSVTGLPLGKYTITLDNDRNNNKTDTDTATVTFSGGTASVKAKE